MSSAATPIHEDEEFIGPRRAGLRGLVTTSILMVVVLTIILGLIYPLAMLGIAQGLFSHQANGSLITRYGKIVGSELIGQNFTEPKYFWGRLSATSPTPYNAANSSGSNLGPTNKVLLENTLKEAALIRRANNLPANYVLPADAVSSSASGLDPDISPAYADLQVARVARVRGLSSATVEALVDKNTSGRDLGLFGEPRVNVLELNLALDGMKK